MALPIKTQTRLLILVFIQLTLSLSQSEASEFQTISSIAQTFESLISEPSTTIEQYNKLATSIHLDPTRNDEKIVVNLIHTAAECKTLLKLSKNSDLALENPNLPIQTRVNSLEQQRLPNLLPIFPQHDQLITNETTFPILKSLSVLKSKLKTTTSEPSSSQTKPQYITLNLVITYVCLISNIFSTQTSNHQVINEFRNADLELSETCGQAFVELKSQFLTSALTLQEADQGQDTSSLHHHILTLSSSKVKSVTNETRSAYITTYHDLHGIVKSANKLESLITTLNSKLEAHVSTDAAINQPPYLKKLHVLSSYYEFIDPAIKQLNPKDVSNLTQNLNTMRNLRRRLYGVMDNLWQQGIVLENNVLSQTLAEITSSISTACMLDQAKLTDLDKLLAKLTFMKLYHELSNRISRLTLNSSVSSSQINDPKLKSLAILAEHVIKSSILEIEYNLALHNQQSLSASSRIKSYTFTLTESVSCSPDNCVQSCYLINGQYPGPPIVVNQHDFLRITVINKLSVPTTIHFHGILQKHTVASDGVAFVTQDPIQPNGMYTYEMHIGEQSGTYMYHGHIGLDLVWLHGPLIISDNPEEWKTLGTEYSYDYERTVMLEEIFHESFEDLIVGMLEEGIDDPPVSSFAINGKSYGNWPQNQGNASGYEVFTVIPGKTYRFRVINMGAGSMLHFTIENHNMTIIEMDGIVTEPVVTNRLELHTGQRYSVLVTMDKGVGNYWIRSRLMGEDGGADNGRAILAYESGSCLEDDVIKMRTQVFEGVSDPVEISEDGWILNELMPNRAFRQDGVYDFPEKSSKRILIDMQFMMVEGKPRYLINGNLFKKPEVTYLESARAGKDIKNDTHVIAIQEGEVIDFVFQNRYDHTGGCDEHPIHLHGHSFWVVASGADEVDMSTIDNQLNVELGNRRQFRDTFTLFPNSTGGSEELGVGCGWAVVRFVANNPGLWFVHCHVTSHMILGKSFVLYEYSNKNPKLLNE